MVRTRVAVRFRIDMHSVRSQQWNGVDWMVPTLVRFLRTPDGLEHQIHGNQMPPAFAVLGWGRRFCRQEEKALLDLPDLDPRLLC